MKVEILIRSVFAGIRTTLLELFDPRLHKEVLPPSPRPTEISGVASNQFHAGPINLTNIFQKFVSPEEASFNTQQDILQRQRPVNKQRCAVEGICRKPAPTPGVDTINLPIPQ